VQRPRLVFLRWALPTLLALAGFFLWRAFRASSPLPTPETDDEAPQLAQATSDPCAGLELLDIAVAGDGSAEGVWLRNRSAGPMLVRPGQQFSNLTLRHIATDGSGSAKLWFAAHPRPCQLTLVPGIDLTRTLPAPSDRLLSPPTPTSSTPAQRKYERVPMEVTPNPASTNEHWDQAASGPRRGPRPAPASIDASPR